MHRQSCSFVKRNGVHSAVRRIIDSAIYLKPVHRGCPRQTAVTSGEYDARARENMLARKRRIFAEHVEMTIDRDREQMGENVAETKSWRARGPAPANRADK